MIFQFLYVPMVFIIKSSSEKSMEKRGIFCKIATLGLTFTCKKSILEFEMKRVSKNWNRVRVSRGRFMKKEKNIYTIAKEAGVSPATVSRVMTKNARVSEEKRKKVEELSLIHI